MSRAAVRRDAVLVFACQPSAGERGEDDGAHALLTQHVGQAILDPPVEHVVARLVDEHRRAHFAQRFDGDPRLLGAVIGDADVERLAAAHDLIQRAHRLLDRRFRIRTVMIEDVDVVEVHALQALVEAGDQVLAAAVVAVRALPHVVAGLGGNDQLVAVGLPVAQEMHAEAALGFAVGRAVVVGEVKMRDAVVKRGAQDGLLRAKGRDIAEVVPQAQRQRGQLQAASAAAAVGHGVVAGFSGDVRHGIPPVESISMGIL